MRSASNVPADGPDSWPPRAGIASELRQCSFDAASIGGSVGRFQADIGAELLAVNTSAVDQAQSELPQEVTTANAAAILGCCKHTVLKFMEDELLEWRNAAPPSSTRPNFRFTLRSVLRVRLAYQVGSAKPDQVPLKLKRKNQGKLAQSSVYQIKHLRRKKGAERHCSG